MFFAVLKFFNTLNYVLNIKFKVRDMQWYDIFNFLIPFKYSNYYISYVHIHMCSFNSLRYFLKYNEIICVKLINFIFMKLIKFHFFWDWPLCNYFFFFDTLEFQYNSCFNRKSFKQLTDWYIFELIKNLFRKCVYSYQQLWNLYLLEAW